VTGRGSARSVSFNNKMIKGNISLLKFVPEYHKLVANWLNDKEINIWLANYWRGKNSSKKVIMAANNPNNLWYVVSYKEQKCGIVALSDIEREDGTAMIWYFLGDKNLSNRNIISIAINKLLKISFEELNLNCIYAWFVEHNKSSSKVLEKNFFCEMGRMPSSFSFNGNLRARKYVYLNYDLWNCNVNKV